MSSFCNIFARAMCMLSSYLRSGKASGWCSAAQFNRSWMSLSTTLLEGNYTSCFIVVIANHMNFIRFKKCSRFNFNKKLNWPQVTHSCCLLILYSWLLNHTQESDFVETSLNDVGGCFSPFCWYLIDSIDDFDFHKFIFQICLFYHYGHFLQKINSVANFSGQLFFDLVDKL